MSMRDLIAQLAHGLIASSRELAIMSPATRAPWCLSFLLFVFTAVATDVAWADELIVDNGDAAVQTVGAWTTTTTTAGYYGPDYRFRTAGDGSFTVTWPFPSSGSAGRYEVFGRWSAGPNRATNATYRVQHGTGAASVSVNQQTNGGTWQSLGSFDFAPGKGQGVVLGDGANGVVVADAVRWMSGGAVVVQAAVQPTAATAPTATTATTATTAPQVTPTPAPADPRFFAQTRYRIAEDPFWDFFQKRGGAKTFGYPVSNTFTLFGMKVQMFQRQILQQRPDGGMQMMNLLDEGLLPYTEVNGSTFPASDPSILAQAPKPADPDYHERALQFVRSIAVDEFDGEPVGFGRAFFGTVRQEDAFPAGAPDDAEGLLLGFNLEIWGLPTSRPTHDPSNRNFIYQRFQRGILHYDKGCGCTQGLLLADSLKAIALNRGVPSDLAAQAKNSRFFAQWSPTQPLGLARPNALLGSNLTGAFRRDPVITIDAGHGGAEIGTSHTYSDGATLPEKSLNLRVAQRVRDLLFQAGLDVNMTRTTDSRVNVDGKDITADGKTTVSDDLQARIDVANRTRSDLLVSIHFNGVSDPNVKGTYVFWDPDRPFSDRSKVLAEQIQAALVKSMKDAGYATVDRGARTDTSVLGGGHYFLLGPNSEVIARPSDMPAVIGEALFLTNDDDANAVRNDRVVEAIARGYVDGINAYLAKYPPS